MIVAVASVPGSPVVTVPIVNVGVSQGFIVGRNSNEFDPLANVTYAELCVMLTKITDYADYAKSSAKDGDAWYKCYTDMAASAGLNKGVNVPLTAALTRGQVSQMIYNALITPKLVLLNILLWIINMPHLMELIPQNLRQSFQKSLMAML